MHVFQGKPAQFRLLPCNLACVNVQSKQTGVSGNKQSAGGRNLLPPNFAVEFHGPCSGGGADSGRAGLCVSTADAGNQGEEQDNAGNSINTTAEKGVHKSPSTRGRMPHVPRYQGHRQSTESHVLLKPASSAVP